MGTEGFGLSLNKNMRTDFLGYHNPYSIEQSLEIEFFQQNLVAQAGFYMGDLSVAKPA